MSIAKVFDHKTLEPEIYKYWENLSLNIPESTKTLRQKYGLVNRNVPFSVLMPPPNANAPLHCGHATYAVQDLVIRYRRMLGYDALYFPGTDHAGFETQVVYERILKKQGKSRFDFDRQNFYDQVFDFVEQNSTLAIDQLKMIGMSADWNRHTFTLDENAVNLVYDTFEKMYKDGMVYRDGYMVNYSSFHGTTFSDLETEYKDAVSPLYYVKYQFTELPEKHITVATVRPETIYADVAIAVNPKDAKYKSYIGKSVINPLNKRVMPIIADTYVDIEFGTGALKITPGHDINDYKIGIKHKLQIISLIDLDGKMNSNAGECEGLFPKQAREKSVEVLNSLGAIEKIDTEYKNRVLVDYKDGLAIEPMILPNWFINMDKLGDLAINSIEKNEVKFNLPMWKRDTLRWIKEKKPWPISRQTVFGIRIPAWYSIHDNPNIQIAFLDSNKKLIRGEVKSLLSQYTIEDIKAGLQKVIAPSDAKFLVSKVAPGDEYLQDTDTFDTWFSSGQWPLTTTRYPNGSDFKNFFPTDFLDSGYEIMFFWIARMIMFSKYLTGKVPFKTVYFHGMVTDKFGKKMSKSKGNTVDPLEMVQKYGADALRMGIIVGGNTEAKFSPFDENQVRGYRNFANKIWNIGRYLEMKEAEAVDSSVSENSESDNQIIKDTNELIKKVTNNLEKMKYKFAGEAVYEFVWERLANEYLEKNKSRTDVDFVKTLRFVYEVCLKLIHPYMPFVSESIWKEINKSKEPLMISSWPTIENER